MWMLYYLFIYLFLFLLLLYCKSIQSSHIEIYLTNRQVLKLVRFILSTTLKYIAPTSIAHRSISSWTFHSVPLRHREQNTHNPNPRRDQSHPRIQLLSFFLFSSSSNIPPPLFIFQLPSFINHSVELFHPNALLPTDL